MGHGRLWGGRLLAGDEDGDEDDDAVAVAANDDDLVAANPVAANDESQRWNFGRC